MCDFCRENTRLLYTYSELDPRVRVLGYMVKLFAKERTPPL
jgi:DNA polymerase sigma